MTLLSRVQNIKFVCHILHFVLWYNFLVQIHPVVSRLCASIQGTSPERLADCLGLDSSKVVYSSLTLKNRTTSSFIFLTSQEIDSCSSKVAQETMLTVIHPVHSDDS